MKRLSEYKDGDAIAVAAKLLGPIGRIARKNKESEIDEAGGSVGEFVGLLMKNSPEDVYEMMAVLSGEDVEDYHINGDEAIVYALNMFSDPVLMTLFTSQSQTKASSGSASESTGDPETPAPSSGTAKPRTKKK